MMKRVLGALLALGVLGLLSWQAFFHIDFDADPLNLLPQGFPQVEAMRTYDQAFASQNDILIVVGQKDLTVGEDATESLLEHLRGRTDLFSSLRSKPPWEEDPSQMGELLAYLWVNGPTDALGSMVSRLSGDGVQRELNASLDVLEHSMDLTEVMRVSRDPLHLSHFDGQSNAFRLDEATRMKFASDDGELHLILAEPARDLKDGSDVTAWHEAVQASLARWSQAQPDLAEGTSIQLTGRKIYMTEVTNALRRDLMISVLITLSFVIVLFSLIYRRILPLILLLLALYVTFLVTLLLGEFIFEELSAMSVGFAAILIGLAVDYGLVIYQESCCSGKDPREQRRVFGRSIGWASLTTACVFLALNRSIMPGAAQLGTMVAIGIAVGAVMMIFPYASALGYFRCFGLGRGIDPLPVKKPFLGSDAIGGWATVVLAMIVALVLGIYGFPYLNADAEKLRPKHRQPAIELYRTVMERLGGDRRTLTVMASADDDQTMFEIFRQGRQVLEDDPAVSSTMVPTRLWPHAERQNANREVIRPLVENQPEILAQAEAEGFTEESLLLTKRAFKAWGDFVRSNEPFTLEDSTSRWLIELLTQFGPEQRLAIGFVRLVEDRFTLPAETVEALNEIGLRPIGWEFLTPEIDTILKHDIEYVVIPTAIFLFVLLGIVFRSLKGICVSVSLLVFSTLVLMAVMQVAGIDWNIVNIAAVPLLLGLGLDYGIHVILSLRRTGGDVGEVRRNIGRALLLCGTTTAVGFGSLRTARHGGLALLGELCAIGILVMMITAVFLVPHWWRFLHRDELHDGVSPES